MSDIDEALEALDLIARGTDHKYPMEHVKIRQALERQRVPDNENFLRHIAAVMTGVLLNCQPKPQQSETDDTNHIGGQCLAELESLRDTINVQLAAAPEPELCEHEWVNAENEVIESGWWCQKCNAVRAATAEPGKAEKVSPLAARKPA